MNSPTPIDRQNVYDRITNEIIAAIESSPGEFRMPWHHDGATTSRPLNVASGKPYRGVNILSLWAAGAGLGFSSGLWGTYRQWSDRGAQVRKGEKGTSVVFWKRLDDVSNSTGRTSPDIENSQKGRLVARLYRFQRRSGGGIYADVGCIARPGVAHLSGRALPLSTGHLNHSRRR